MATDSRAPDLAASPAAVALAFGVLVSVPLLAFATDGEWQDFFGASWTALPFAVLCVLAHLGRDRVWARVLAWGWLGLLLFLAAGTSLALGALSVVPTWVEDDPFSAVPAAYGWLLVGLALALWLAVLTPLLALWPAVRRWWGLDQTTPARTLGLGAVLGFTAVFCLPLLVLGRAPLLVLLELSAAAGHSLMGDRGAAGLLRDEVYGLCWTLGAAGFAVGWGVVRTFPEARRRLGLVRPTARQWAFGLLMIGVVLGASHLFDAGVAALWQRLGWRVTDDKAMEALFGWAMSPLAAVVIGLTAGLGEEVAVRGILQPRLGILASNLLFTALHAWQYQWDALLSVFVFGLVLGWIRRRTNTTVSALVHGGYDFVLLLLAAAGP